MKKNSIKKLKLNRETLRDLEERTLFPAVGGDATYGPPA